MGTENLTQSSRRATLHGQAQRYAPAMATFYPTALKAGALFFASGFLIVACAPGPLVGASDQDTDGTTDSSQEFAPPVGGSGWEPGTYLPEHCEDVSPDAVAVFENLVSERDASDCVAPFIAEISMGTEVVTAEETGEDLYGISQYLRVYRLLDRVPTIGQFGQWGQWIGSDAHHQGSFNSIEGGLFVHDKMGRSYYPKYMASAATHLYSGTSDTGGGWGFYERRISCDVLGRITVSNKMIVPPNLISFDEDQDPYEEDGGISVGTSWVALPLIDGQERNDATGQTDGLLTWTFVIDAANYSGPLIAYAPQHWDMRLARWNSLEMLADVFEWLPGEKLTDPAGQALVDHVDGIITEEDMLPLIRNEQWYQDWWADPSKTHGVSPAGRYVPTGIELAPVPVFAIEEEGRTFLKTFPPRVPRVLDQEALALNLQTFDSSVYNAFVDTFQPASPAAAWEKTLDGLGFPSRVERNREKEPLVVFHHLDERGEDYYDNPNISFTLPLLALEQKGETNIVFDWSSTPRAEREISTYFELVGSTLVPRDESQVPTKLTLLEYGNLESPTNLRNHLPHIEKSGVLGPEDTFSTKCWSCDDPAGCDPEIHETTLDDGSVVRYRWYRFTDQPVFWNLKNEFPDLYSDAKLQELQETIEMMHQKWDGSVNLLERPASTDAFHLAEIDHGLIVEPPAGKEIGWVPIVWEVEHPDGQWQDEIVVPEVEGQPWPRR